MLYKTAIHLTHAITAISRFGQYDIYHPTYYKINKLVDGKTKKIITAHDLTQEKFPQIFGDNSRILTLKSRQINWADGIIAVSEETKKDLINFYGVSSKKIRVISHANSLKIPVVSEPLINSPYILFVGNQKGYKNFQILLSAYTSSVNLNTNFSLVCFGGQKEFGLEGNKLIEKLNLSEKIISISGLDELLVNLYQYASVFVYPSLNEGFGIPLLEAMYYGCPVLASNISCFPEIAQDAAIYFDPHNVEDLIQKLELLLNSKQLREKIINNGRQRELNFSWETAARETLNFYREIAENE